MATPNNNGAGTHQPSNTQANGTENELRDRKSVV